jgi:hypothetical protein
MITTLELGSVDPALEERRRSRFRWELRRLLHDCLTTSVPVVVEGRLQPDVRMRLATLLRQHRLYREALDADKLMQRAYDWSISRERITFAIERHPLGVVLLQTWAIDVRTGTLEKTREKYICLQRLRRGSGSAKG